MLNYFYFCFWNDGIYLLFFNSSLIHWLLNDSFLLIIQFVQTHPCCLFAIHLNLFPPPPPPTAKSFYNGGQNSLRLKFEYVMKAILSRNKLDGCFLGTYKVTVRGIGYQWIQWEKCWFLNFKITYTSVKKLMHFSIFSLKLKKIKI